MNNLLRFLQRFHSVLLFLLLLVASLWMYIETSYYQKARIGSIANSITGSVSSRFLNIGQYMKLKETNSALHEENILLKNELERYKNILHRGGLYSRIDSLNDKSYTYISARVVNNTTNRLYNYITLNVGLNEGIKEGMGVACTNGVVGVIASVSEHYATVLSMLNIYTKISAKHKKSGVFGSLLWNGENYQKVTLSDIPLHVQLEVGDTIVTSGYSAIFPRNIPIGSIVDFEMDEGNVYNISVKLFTDFKRLDYVYVVNATDSFERTQLEQQNHD